MDVSQIRRVVSDAVLEAKRVGQLANAQLAPESTRGFDCGFAWVVCKPGNGTLAKVMKEFGADKHHAGGVSLWNPAQLSTQSVGPKEAGAKAFVDYVKEHLRQDGYTDLFYSSRLD